MSLGVAEAGGGPVEGVGRHVERGSGAEAHDEAVLASALRRLDEGAADEGEVGVGDGGDLQADGEGVAHPLAALAGGVVDDRVLGAGAVGLDADGPDPFEQGVGAAEGAFGGAVVGALAEGGVLPADTLG